jgi:hypothetical protein
VAVECFKEIEMSETKSKMQGWVVVTEEEQMLAMQEQIEVLTGLVEAQGKLIENLNETVETQERYIKTTMDGFREALTVRDNQISVLEQMVAQIAPAYQPHVGQCTPFRGMGYSSRPVGGTGYDTWTVPRYEHTFRYDNNTTARTNGNWGTTINSTDSNEMYNAIMQDMYVWTAVHAQPTTLTEDQYNDAYRSAMKRGDVDAMKQSMGYGMVDAGKQMAAAYEQDVRAAMVTGRKEQPSGFHKVKKWLTNSK